jgi:hypothetical protein
VEVLSAQSLVEAKQLIAEMPIDWVYLNRGKNQCNDEIENGNKKKVYNSYTYKCASHIALFVVRMNAVLHSNLKYLHSL